MEYCHSAGNPRGLVGSQANSVLGFYCPKGNYKKAYSGQLQLSQSSLSFTIFNQIILPVTRFSN